MTKRNLARSSRTQRVHRPWVSGFERLESRRLLSRTCIDFDDLSPGEQFRTPFVADDTGFSMEIGVVRLRDDARDVQVAEVVVDSVSPENGNMVLIRHGLLDFDLESMSACCVGFASCWPPVLDRRRWRLMDSGARLKRSNNSIEAFIGGAFVTVDAALAEGATTHSISIDGPIEALKIGGQQVYGRPGL